VVICPVKDEAWILDKFLNAVSLFADHIVVLDHNSTDGSREIAARFPKADVLEYSNDDFDENARRRLLLERARHFGRGNVIFALDADEFLTPSFLSSEIQEKIYSAPEGTRFRVPLANLKPGLKEFWREKMDPIAIVDDGSIFEHEENIHFPRLPVSNKAGIVYLQNVFLMHLQHADWNRMLSKRRWYMAWERINFPSKPALRILRRYNHMNVVQPSQTSQVPEGWIEVYEKHNIKLRELPIGTEGYRWDSIVRSWVEQGQVRDWYLLFSAWDRDSLGLDLESQQINEVNKLQYYLRITSGLYSKRRFLHYRVVLRLFDEIACALFLRLGARPISRSGKR